jgi:hypothetical protein
MANKILVCTLFSLWISRCCVNIGTRRTTLATLTGRIFAQQSFINSYTSFFDSRVSNDDRQTKRTKKKNPRVKI